MIGSEALKPNPALQPLATLVGEWRLTGEHPLLPGRVLPGRCSFAWHEGGAFLIMRAEMDDDEIPDAVAIIGSDDAAGSLTMIYFDVRDVSRRYDLALIAGGLVWERDEAGFAQHNTLLIEPGGDRMVRTGRMRRDGGDWEDDLRLAYERISSD